MKNSTKQTLILIVTIFVCIFLLTNATAQPASKNTEIKEFNTDQEKNNKNNSEQTCIFGFIELIIEFILWLLSPKI